MKYLKYIFTPLKIASFALFIMLVNYKECVELLCFVRMIGFGISIFILIISLIFTIALRGEIKKIYLIESFIIGLMILYFVVIH